MKLREFTEKAVLSALSLRNDVPPEWYDRVADVLADCQTAHLMVTTADHEAAGAFQENGIDTT